jgi:putative transposase
MPKGIHWAKSGLNKSILDQGWSEFRRQLHYKLDWNGGILVAVPPHNTSRTCPDCDRVAAENRPTQAHFECVGCGYENHADVVGAINVLARGYRVAACRGRLWLCSKEQNETSLGEAGTRRSDYG